MSESAVLLAVTQMSLPAAVIDLGAADDPLDARVVAANEAMDRLLVGPGETSVGRAVHEFTMPDRRSLATENLRLLATTQIDGYQVDAQIRDSNGRAVRAHVSFRRLRVEGRTNLAAAIIITRPDVVATRPEVAPLTGPDVDLGLILTDSAWVIEQRSDGVVKLLECATDLVGKRLLDLVHAEDTPGFLLAIAKAIASTHTVAARVRVTADGRRWRDATCLVSSVSAVDPLRLGVVVLPDETPAGRTPDRMADLQLDLVRIMKEGVKAAGLLPSLVANGETDPRVAKLAELSSRQREIVMRLLTGERAPQIARDMYLSPSTVRNHLTTVFRRFGVHSQVELIALLRGLAQPQESITESP